jgi:hypothetical protein
MTFGENHGKPVCTIPDDGFPWQPTRQPVVLDAWPVRAGSTDGPFSTVMQWDSYPVREFAGRQFGMKSQSFEPYRRLPSQTQARLQLAVGNASAPRDELRHDGWEIVDPLAVTRDPWTYQEFIRQSKGEFSVAKHGYVTTWSGWFSERSAAYLASGRPVVVQDTGFSTWVATGMGLIAFSSPEEAMAGLDAVNGSYERHCRSAREIAGEYFDSRKVLGALLEECD